MFNSSADVLFGMATVGRFVKFDIYDKLQIFDVLEVNTQFYYRGVYNVYSLRPQAEVNILITHTKVIKLCIH